MRDAGVSTVAMEVSSHALDQHRVDGTWFAAVGFTNLTHDHLDYHGSIEAYFDAKARLFHSRYAQAGAINIDDEHGRELVRRVREDSFPIVTFAIDDVSASVGAEDLQVEATGSRFILRDRRTDEAAEVHLSLLGRFNVSNALAAAATALAGGFTFEAVADGLAREVAVPGRFERVDAGQPFTTVVDYAHTPDALSSVLREARTIADAKRVIVVFGCGGDRDREKRPLMGAAAATGADLAVLTSDNPRGERAEVIAEQVLSGMRGPAEVIVELDRRAAISLALRRAAPGDVVIVAGKGHETGQTIGNVTNPFDDRTVVREELERDSGLELSLAEIVDATRGEVLTGAAETVASGFAIDSRRLLPGSAFVALRSTRDGHDFVGDAFARGATVALVERPVDTSAGALVRVDDTVAALQSLGRLARERLTGATFVGITGSAGKTATKDLTAAAVGRVRRVHASPESFNNEAGVPLTLLGAPLGTEVVITEMGARFAGNIADLAAIARPSIGVVTQIGLAHAGLLGGREGIARVKGELLEALPPEGLAVLNAECDATEELATRTAARVIRVGRGADADLRASDISFDELRPRFLLETPAGTARVAIELRGEHQVENAMQAVAVALELGVPLEAAVAGLADARPAAHRMELLRTPDDVLVINDAYNSSPTSAAAAIHALARLQVRGRRVAVLGEMLELGDHADDQHAAIGALVAEQGIDMLVAVGDRAEGYAEGAASGRVTVVKVADADAAARLVADELHSGDAVLVKASRAVGLERVVHALSRRGAGT
jgi:murE/murF fusion protein